MPGVKNSDPEIRDNVEDRLAEAITNLDGVDNQSVAGLLDQYLDAAISSRSSHDDPDPNGYIDAPISEAGGSDLTTGSGDLIRTSYSGSVAGDSGTTKTLVSGAGYLLGYNFTDNSSTSNTNESILTDGNTYLSASDLSAYGSRTGLFVGFDSSLKFRIYNTYYDSVNYDVSIDAWVMLK